MKLPSPIPLLLLVLGYLSFTPMAMAGLPNAWQITDDSTVRGGLLSYTNRLTSEQHMVATNPTGGGFVYTVRARFVADHGNQTMAMAYGLGDRRFQIGFDLNAPGDLVATLLGGGSYTLTRGGTGTNLYHTHSIQFNPTNGTARYLVDGVTIANNWPAIANPLAAGQVYWGAGSSPGRGIMNFHQVTFQVNGLGVVASYDGGTTDNPDPAAQGWTRQQDMLFPGMGNGSVPDLALVPIPAWWQMWWFRGLVIGGLAGVVFGAYEWRIYRHKKARALQEAFARRLIESQEQERKRVAGELHDSLGQNLLVIKNRTALALTHRDQPEKMAEQVSEISTLASAAIREVREIAQNLRPFQIDELGLTKSIASMARKVGDASGLEFRVELDDIDGALPPEFEINFYRIVQECLNNVVKHSQAKTVSIVLRREPQGFRLTVQDDGRGFHGERYLENGGFGLKNITERARTMGGEVRVQSSPGAGARVELTNPLR
jgi:signal transduction histidine kinase